MARLGVRRVHPSIMVLLHDAKREPLVNCQFFLTIMDESINQCSLYVFWPDAWCNQAESVAGGGGTVKYARLQCVLS